MSKSTMSSHFSDKKLPCSQVAPGFEVLSRSKSTKKAGMWHYLPWVMAIITLLMLFRQNIQDCLAEPRPLLKIDDGYGRHLVELQTQLSRRISEHNLVMTTLHQDLTISLSNMSTTMDSILADTAAIQPLLQASMDGSPKRTIAALLNQLVEKFNDAIEGIGDSVRVSLEDIIKTVEQMSHELDTMEVFMEDYDAMLKAWTAAMANKREDGKMIDEINSQVQEYDDPLTLSKLQDQMITAYLSRISTSLTSHQPTNLPAGNITPPTMVRSGAPAFYARISLLLTAYTAITESTLKYMCNTTLLLRYENQHFDETPTVKEVEKMECFLGPRLSDSDGRRGFGDMGVVQEEVWWA